MVVQVDRASDPNRYDTEWIEHTEVWSMTPDGSLRITGSLKSVGAL
jgi:hypothetical protein